MKLTRDFSINPAYDCIVNPCKFGDDKCKPNRGGSHGRHGAELLLSVHDDIAELMLVMFTNWDTSVTPNVRSTHIIWYMPAYLNVHTSYPTDEDSTKIANCNKWSECYNRSLLSSMADEPKRLLIEEGSDKCYEWLEDNFNMTLQT